EHEVSKGLSEAFGKAINVQTNRASDLSFDVAVGLESPTIGNSSVYAGVLVGGTSLVAAALGAGIVIPIIGMDGLPLIQEKIRDYQWEQVKPEMIAETYQLINNTFSDFTQHIQSFISHMVDQIEIETIHIFQQQLEYRESLIQEQ